MLNMTDDTGMLQHAIFSVPNAVEGYTTDDNARALIVSTLLDEDPIASGQAEVSKSLPSLPGVPMACLSIRNGTVQKLSRL